jgi:uncharacterized protein (TIGR02597 family)
MKLKTAIPSIAAALLAAAPFASAQNATTDPVGFVNVTVNANSDQNIGVPMVPSAVYSGVASNVSGTSVSAAGVPSLASASYLLVTSGPAAGLWETVSSTTNSSVTIASSISGFSGNHSFVIRPFWTLGTLFPGGGNVPQSPDPFNPTGLVLVNDPSAVGVNLSPSSAYFYHDGSLGPAGWYINGDLAAGLQDNTPLPPETPIIIRNPTGSPLTISFTGSVPAQKFAMDVVSRSSGQQDNRIYNQFPANVSLANAGLISSGALAPSPDPFNPTDLLIVNNLGQSGFNPSPDLAYFYHDGSLGPAGWYINGDLGAGIQDSVELPAGSSVIIRKAGGISSTIPYAPNLPYSL